MTDFTSYRRDVHNRITTSNNREELHKMNQPIIAVTFMIITENYFIYVNKSTCLFILAITIVNMCFIYQKYIKFNLFWLNRFLEVYKNIFMVRENKEKIIVEEFLLVYKKFSQKLA